MRAVRSAKNRKFCKLQTGPVCRSVRGIAETERIELPAIPIHLRFALCKLLHARRWRLAIIERTEEQIPASPVETVGRPPYGDDLDDILTIDHRWRTPRCFVIVRTRSARCRSGLHQPVNWRPLLVWRSDQRTDLLADVDPPDLHSGLNIRRLSAESQLAILGCLRVQTAKLDKEVSCGVLIPRVMGRLLQGKEYLSPRQNFSLTLLA